MTAVIGQLIDKLDTSELVGLRLAEILLEESAEQESLAASAGKDTTLWKLRVFHERALPWEEWLAAPAYGSEDATPIVAVSFDKSDFEKARSDVVERQTAIARYHVDCYGYGVSGATVSGQETGDARAALASQRAARLVRNILMAGAHTYLGMRGVVGERWVQSIQSFQPQQDGRVVQHIVGSRLTVEVRINEFSPQVQGHPCELITTTARRAETGEVFFVTQSPEPEDAILAPLLTRSSSTAHAGTTRVGYLGGGTNTASVRIPAGGGWLRQCICAAYESAPGSWVAGTITPRVLRDGVQLDESVNPIGPPPAAGESELDVALGERIWFPGGSLLSVEFEIAADFDVGGSSVWATALPIVAFPTSS